MNKKIGILTSILSVAFVMSCDEEKIISSKKEDSKVNVESVVLKEESRKETKAFFGTLSYSRATTFVAQQSGVITKLNAIPGQNVKKGEEIVMYPPLDHQLQIDQVKIEYNKVRQDLDRQKQLFEAGAVSKVSVLELKAHLDLQSKTVQQLKRVNIVSAPFSGVITQVNTDLGEEVSIGVPLFSIAQTSDAKVDFFVTPEDISKIKIGASVSIAKNGTPISGRITKKSIQVDPNRKAFLVTATFENSDMKFVGNTVELEVEIAKATPSIWIPIDGFRNQGKSNYAFVIENEKAVKRNIVIGSRNETNVQVLNGLKEGNRLVTAGLDKLEDGTLIATQSKN